MKKITLVFAGLFSIAIVVSACKDSKKEAEKSELHEHEHESESHDVMANNAVFQCPMDCEKGKTYEEKGNCPVCKMDLKSKEGSLENDHESHDESEHSDSEGNHDEGEHEEESDDHGESEDHDSDK